MAGWHTIVKGTNVGMAHDSKRHKWREKPESIKFQKNGICEKRKSQEGWEMSVSMGPTFLREKQWRKMLQIMEKCANILCNNINRWSVHILAANTAEIWGEGA